MLSSDRTADATAASRGRLSFAGYDPEPLYDELIDAHGEPRAHAKLLIERVESLEPGELQRRQVAAERALFRMGVTFSVYGDSDGTEKIFPFDIIPRIVPNE